MAFKLALHDTIRLTRDGQHVELRSKKAQALLVYLALTGKPQSREHLATLLWGERPDDQARRSLRQVLFALRKALGPDALAGEEQLSIARDTLQLEPGPRLLPEFHTGAEEFDTWLAEARSTRAKKAAAEFVLEAEAHAQRLDDEAALGCYRSALMLTPSDEQVLRRVMEILDRLDRRAEALQEFEAFRLHLRTDLDVEPGKETLSLAETLRETETPTEMETDHPNALLVPFEDLGGGEMAIYQSDLGILSGHKTADLRKKRDQGHLPQIRTLAGHIRPGDDVNAMILGKGRVVRHEAFRDEQSLYHRVPPPADFQYVIVRQFGADVAMPRRDIGEGGCYIEAGEGGSRLHDALSVCRQFVQKFPIELAFYAEKSPPRHSAV